MKTSEEVLTMLRALKAEMRTKYHARQIGLFGSVVRGEARDTSDVDVLVEFDEQADLFDLMGLACFLEEKLQRRVDVVSKQALRAEMRDAVLREVAPL